MRDKQIEEMAALLKNCLFCEVRYNYQYNFVERIFDYEDIAETIIEEGYRKASDVALEVIGEVVSKAKAIFCPDCDYDVADIRYNLDWLEAELKKKYKSEGEE